MKLKAVLYLGLLVLISMTAISGCDLEPDITPPPGYPTSTNEKPSATPAPSQVILPTNPIEGTGLASTQGINPVSTPQNSPLGGINTSTGIPDLTVTGTVSEGSGSKIPGTLTARLYLYNTGTNTIDQTLSTEVRETSQFQFDHVAAKSQTTYIVTVENGGVTYPSEPITFDGKSRVLDMPVTIFDATKDLDSLSFSQIHMQFEFGIEGQVQANILYIVSNLGQKSVIIQSDGSNIPFIQIPSGASGVQFEMAQGGAQLMMATNGFALMPGSDRQYGIIASFTLPYSHSLNIVQPFTLPVSSATIIVPVGVRVNSDQLDDVGTQSFQGTNYHLYQGGNLASGGTLVLTISGKPGSSTSSFLGDQRFILVGVGVIGLLLIGIGMFLFLRGRGRHNQLETDPGVNVFEATQGGDQDTIVDAIIVLDDQYKSGQLSKEAYQKRRDDLKNTLRELS